MRSTIQPTVEIRIRHGYLSTLLCDGIVSSPHVWLTSHIELTPSLFLPTAPACASFLPPFCQDVADMKKKETANEKLMYEVAQENKRLTEPLAKALKARGTGRERGH